MQEDSFNKYDKLKLKEGNKVIDENLGTPSKSNPDINQVNKVIFDNNK